MAFDQSTRNRLARFVSDARRILTDEFTRQCKQDYGIDPDTGEVSDIARLTHLNDTQRATARILRETLDHYVAGSPSGGKKTSIDRIIREQAFTTLNRLCAVRMAEARGIVIESVGKGPQSKGFALYARVAGSALGETADAYRCYLFSIFDEIALDLPPLFDRFSPKGRLFPSATALDSLLAEINHVDLDPLWGEDETIGWLYQYFNSIEERKQMRDESAAPRNSRELAVRNQFFTPRYVVEFLTDNTLGRIWYEMTKGETVLKDTCRYLVRRPSEVFLAEGQEAPAQDQSTDNLSQEELLKQPVHIPHRPLKDPREIRLLDPACGSMHFGLYAFDLFTTIYDEAWELAHGSAGTRPQSPAFADFIAFAATFKDKAAFLREVPRLIIEHNIHGIDIDPRAVQIAGLSLWLRAQRAWHQAGVKPAERPRITRSHIVCAEPMPGEKALLQEFVQQQFQENERPVFGYLLEQVFDQMKLAGEAGSLLQIEESIRTSIAEAKRRWQQGPQYEQSPLFPEAVARPGQGQMRLDLSGITDEQFWERAEQRIYDALGAYSERAENSGGFQRRLFADDAAQGFAFIFVCRQRYDVVVMNPPFGEVSDAVAPFLERRYPDWNKNLLCAFCSCALQVLGPSGAMGAIIDKTSMIKSTYAPFRNQVLRVASQGQLYIDLGWGVLDANVETAALVLDRSSIVHHSLLKVSRLSLDSREGRLEAMVDAIRRGDTIDGGYQLPPRHLALFPNQSIPFDIDDWMIPVLVRCRLFESVIGRALAGHSLKSDINFRLFWEIPETAGIGAGEYWATLYNGGEFSRYFTVQHDVTRYGRNGDAVPPHVSTRWCNLRDQQKPGVGWGKRGEYVDTHVMPAGSVFTVEGQGLPIADVDQRWLALGLMNSPLFSFLMNVFCGQHKYAGYVNVCPVPLVQADCMRRIVDATRQIVDRIWRTCQYDETAREFCGLGLAESLLQSAHERCASIQDCVRELESLDAAVVKACFEWYQVPASGRSAVMAFWERCPTLAESFAGLSVAADAARALAADAVSVGVGTAFARWHHSVLRASGRGAMVDAVFNEPPWPQPAKKNLAQGHRADVLVSDTFGRCDLTDGIRQAWQDSFGQQSLAFEQECCGLLEVSSLKEHVQNVSGFFAAHLNRYSKSRRQAPIYWPLSTPSGSYTLWLYYHRLTDQTLFKAVNDFVEPKLQQIASQTAALRGRLSRSSADNAELERLSDFEIELTEFRDELLRLAKVWKPNLNDGVVITAAPLWKLFQYKPWQKKLKETWEALEAGEYDWAHLAYSLWPDRVREKCKHDKSLAIAHGLEELYQEPPAAAGKKRGRKPKVADPELMEDAE